MQRTIPEETTPVAIPAADPERNLMPIYQCYAPQGLLTKAAKTQIAEEIGNIHCNATGAEARL